MVVLQAKMGERLVHLADINHNQIHMEAYLTNKTSLLLMKKKDYEGKNSQIKAEKKFGVKK
jgi:hypothetical protein